MHYPLFNCGLYFYSKVQNCTCMCMSKDIILEVTWSTERKRRESRNKMISPLATLCRPPAACRGVWLCTVDGTITEK